MITHFTDVIKGMQPVGGYWHCCQHCDYDLDWLGWPGHMLACSTVNAMVLMTMDHSYNLCDCVADYVCITGCFMELALASLLQVHLFCRTATARGLSLATMLSASGT